MADEDGRSKDDGGNQKVPFVITALRLAGMLSIVIGCIQVVSTFGNRTATGVALGLLVIAFSTIFFGLAHLIQRIAP